LRKGEISDYCYFVQKGIVSVYVQVDDIEQDEELKDYLNNNFLDADNYLFNQSSPTSSPKKK
jgi:CRP-like cAMP-binding protein